MKYSIKTLLDNTPQWRDSYYGHDKHGTFARISHIKRKDKISGLAYTPYPLRYRLFQDHHIFVQELLSDVEYINFSLTPLYDITYRESFTQYTHKSNLETFPFNTWLKLSLSEGSFMVFYGTTMQFTVLETNASTKFVVHARALTFIEDITVSD